MSLRIIKRNPSGGDKEVILEIDPVGSGGSDQTYSVRGKALDAKSQGVANVTIRAFHKSLTTSGDIPLGTDQVTNSQGDYLIYYNTSELPPGRQFADLHLKAYDSQETLLAETPTFTNALPNETINILVSNVAFVGLSEYQQVKLKLEPYLSGLTLTDITLDGLNILASNSGFPIKVVTDFIKGRIEAENINEPTLTEEVFYGFFRYNLPYNVRTLWNLTDARLIEALNATKASNIIDPDIDDAAIQAILAAIAGQRTSQLLIDPISLDGNSYLEKILSIAGVSDTPTKEAFAGVYTTLGQEDDFWERSETLTALNESTTLRDAVKLALQIGVITQEHAPMVAVVFPGISVLSDLAAITHADWIAYMDVQIQDPPIGGNTKVGVPDMADEDVTIIEKTLYADALMTAVEKAFPTEMLREFMDGEVVFTDVYNFLVANLAFNIKESSPRNYFASENITDQELIEQILEVKRLWHLSSGYNKLAQIKILQANELTSAAQIANLGRRTFIKRYAGEFHEDEAKGIAEAERIYSIAVKRTGAAVQLQAAYNPAVNTLSTRVFTSTDLDENNGNNPANLDVLFGSQDYCACTHCRSSFSPSAYLIDLLGFLQRTQVYDSNNDLSGDSAWDILKQRRPEFKEIELSCENTNTTLPYIDLTNEILETAVVQHIEGDVVLDRQTTRDAKSLRVFPEYLNAAAYEKLFDGSNESVYPWLLPFHLWNEEAKGYLGLVDIGREEIVSTLEASDTLSAEAARVALGICDAMKSVLQDNTFTEYYKVADSGQLVNVKDFLQQAGISYEELVELLDTGFVNPENKQIVFTPSSSCSLEDATLTFSNSDTDLEYRNLHKFVRLKRLLGWSTVELDMAFTAFGVTKFENESALHSILVQLAGIRKIANRFRIPVAEALAWYGPLSERSYAGKPSQYASVYLNTVYNNDPGVLQTFSDEDPVPLVVADQLDAVNSPVVLGALRMKSSDLLLLITEEIGLTDGAAALDRNELGHLYRVASFVRALRIPLKDYLDLKNLLEIDPLSAPDGNATPNDTLIFLALYDKLRVSAFKISDLRFLFFHQAAGTYKMDTAAMDRSLDTLRTKLQERLIERGIDEAVWADIETSVEDWIDELQLDEVLAETLSKHFGVSGARIKTILSELETNSTLLSDAFVLSTDEISALPVYQDISNAWLQAGKVSFCLEKLRASEEDIPFVISGSATTDWYDLSSLPLEPPTEPQDPWNFDAFIRLLEGCRLAGKFATDDFSLMAHLQSGSADYDTLAQVTGWDLDDIQYFVSLPDSVFAYDQKGGWVANLERAFNLLEKLGLSGQQMAELNTVDLTQEQAQILRAGIKSNFSESAWLKVAEEVRDKLRVKQRDALSAFLIGHSDSPAFKDKDDLYAHFLIDTEMAPCTLTSRIRLALSSLQLWVQRIRMELEPDIRFSDEDMDEWEWRKNYRVWEAARKVFLYPENWLEPELRDDKSPFFKEMEDELLQDEVNMTTAENAYLNYLSKLDDVAFMEISGVYREVDRNILHVFARTKNSPHVYYYRKQEDGFRWTAWDRIDLDIEGNHLIPVIFNRRPMIFWPVFLERPKDIPENDLNVTTSNGAITKDVPNKKPVSFAEVKMAFSEWKNNKWQAKKLSKVGLLSSEGFTPQNYFFKVDISQTGLSIDTFYHENKTVNFGHIGGFALNNCTGELEIVEKRRAVTPPNFTVKNAFRHNMAILEEEGNERFSIVDRFLFKQTLLIGTDELINASERVILNKTPGRFKISYPVSGVDLLSEVPFFFEDQGRVFLVKPSEKAFEREILLNISPKLLWLRMLQQVAVPTEPVISPYQPIQNLAPVTVGSSYTSGSTIINGGLSLSGIDGDRLNSHISYFEILQVQ